MPPPAPAPLLPKTTGALTLDAFGGLVLANQYMVVRHLGRGAQGSVKLVVDVDESGQQPAGSKSKLGRCASRTPMASPPSSPSCSLPSPRQ